MSTSVRTERRTLGPLAFALALLLLATSSAVAQTSASFKLQESVVNAGGRPAQGTIGSSAGFRVKLDAIGEPVVNTAPSSGSFRLDSGFVSAYPPPGEVLAVRFTSKTTLAWNPEKSVGKYELYRGTVASLPGTWGTCLTPDLAGATATDASTPPAASGWFYLVTARNRLKEEGTKGRRSDGAERANTAPCP